MADYSWVTIVYLNTDTAILERVEEKFGNVDDSGHTKNHSYVSGEKSYGLAEEVEEYLTAKGIAWSRYSDGKYDYDGDETHWRPGMEKPRSFSRLNNEGRVFTRADFEKVKGLSLAKVGAVVREHFLFEGVDDGGR